jgi:hypothetical protein
MVLTSMRRLAVMLVALVALAAAGSTGASITPASFAR